MWHWTWAAVSSRSGSNNNGCHCGSDLGDTRPGVKVALKKQQPWSKNQLWQFYSVPAWSCLGVQYVVDGDSGSCYDKEADARIMTRISCPWATLPMVSLSKTKVRPMFNLVG